MMFEKGTKRLSKFHLFWSHCFKNKSFFSFVNYKWEYESSRFAVLSYLNLNFQSLNVGGIERVWTNKFTFLLRTTAKLTVLFYKKFLLFLSFSPNFVKSFLIISPWKTKSSIHNREDLEYVTFTCDTERTQILLSTKKYDSVQYHTLINAQVRYRKA